MKTFLNEDSDIQNSKKVPILTISKNKQYKPKNMCKNGKLYWKPLGWINLKGYRPEITGKIKHIRIQLKNSQWFIIIVYDSVLPEPFPKTGKEVGIDLGIKTLATLSYSKAKATLKLNQIEAKIKKNTKRTRQKKNTAADTIKKH